MKSHQLSELVLDFDLYPRGDVDSYHIASIAEAIAAGAQIPPIVIDKESKRVVDGFHRWRALRRLYGEDHSTECVEKQYKSDSEMLLDAMRYNSAHGRALTTHDKTRCLILAAKYNLSDAVVCDALHITTTRIDELRTTRIGKVGPKTSNGIPLKGTIRHKAGKRLTKRQIVANDKLGGQSALFYVNQLILLLDNNLLDPKNDRLVAGLMKLASKIQQHFQKAAA